MILSGWNDTENKEWVSFVTPMNKFEFFRMPFGM